MLGGLVRAQGEDRLGRNSSADHAQARSARPGSPVHGGLAGVGGAVANDPEHPAGQRRGGLVVITVVTSSLTCLIPVVGEMVPSTFAGVRDCAEGNGGKRLRE